MDFVVLTLILTVFLSTSRAESTEEDQPYSQSYAPSTVNVQEIYTNSLTKISEAEADDKTSANEEETQANIPTQVAEFHPKVLKISRLTPPPKILLKSSYVQKTETGTENPNTIPASMYTDETEEPMRVIPVRDQQKGVLDLLFPASRVKTFKSVFDSVRRLLSSTFRK